MKHGNEGIDGVPEGEIVIYRTEDGNTRIDVRVENETVWLTQQQLSELFQTSRTNVVEHIRNIYEEGELAEGATCRKFRQVRKEGERTVAREIPHYNLDLIISLGGAVESRRRRRKAVGRGRVRMEFSKPMLPRTSFTPQAMSG